MELNELTNVIERSMKTISSSITRNLARTAAYEVLSYYEEKANEKISWSESLENSNVRKCTYNNLPIATVEKKDVGTKIVYEYKTNFPVGQHDPTSVGHKDSFEEAQEEVEKYWSAFLQKMF
jgi:hypothetical protein